MVMLAALARRRCSLYGVRPNSVVQTTSVSSSMPARFQVREQAGDRPGRRSSPAGRASSMSPWASQLFEEPASISSMNRTPRSASRRATRHCQAKPCGACRAPGRRARASRRSPATGRRPRAPRVCMPKAVSNDRMRAARAGSSPRAVAGGLGSVGPEPRQLELLQRAGRSRAAGCRHRLGAGDDARSLVAAGQEVGAPGLVAGVGDCGRDHDERRQVRLTVPRP